jgi:hypothetical protein
VGVDFLLAKRSICGREDSPEAAMAEFQAEYKRWLEEQPKA